MRISDWSSDVCSSDLELGAGRAMARLGLSDAGAEKDVRELRELLGAWRDAKKAARNAVLGWVVRGVLAMVLMRSEEHTSELQSLMRISYAVYCLKKKQNRKILKQSKTAKQHTTQKQYK